MITIHPLHYPLKASPTTIWVWGSELKSSEVMSGSKMIWVVAGCVSLWSCSSWRLTHPSHRDTTRPTEGSLAAQVVCATNMSTRGIWLESYYIRVDPWIKPLAFGGARFFWVKTRGLVREVPKGACGCTEIAIAGTDFRLGITDRSAYQFGWSDGKVSGVAGDVIHAFVFRVDGYKIDVKRLGRLSLKFGAGLDICSYRMVNASNQGRDVSKKKPTPAITPFKTFRITKKMVTIRANIIDSSFRWIFGGTWLLLND